MHDLGLGIITPYLCVALFLNSLITLLTYREIRGIWDRLPPMKWKTISFLLGLMAVLVASLLEIPILIPLLSSDGLPLWGLAVLGLMIGPVEEFSKLLPAKMFREEMWVLWKKTIGGAFFFGLIESILYSVQLLIAGEPLLALLRFTVVGLHVAFTLIAATSLITKGSWGAYLRVSLYHSLYDLPFVLNFAGYGGSGLYALMALGTAALLATALEVLSVNNDPTCLIGDFEEPVFHDDCLGEYPFE